MSNDGKIIVDDDWKSQAEREKAELSEKLDNQPAPEAREVPDASLKVHLESLAYQAMMMLGLVEYPGAEGQRIFDPQQAKFLIDTLVVLKEKTEGNRNEEEDQMLEKMIPEMQMAYVEVLKAVAAQEAAQGGAGAGPGPSIVTE